MKLNQEILSNLFVEKKLFNNFENEIARLRHCVMSSV